VVALRVLDTPDLPARLKGFPRDYRFGFAVGENLSRPAKIVKNFRI
jgi:hypothetical protein